MSGSDPPDRAPSAAENRARLARQLQETQARPRAFPLSFAQERIWFVHQLNPDSPTYNIPGELYFASWIAEPVLERCLNELVARHESLRTTFEFRDEGAVQVVAPHGRLRLEVVDLRQVGDPEQQLARLRREELLAPFDLESGPLIRARLLRWGASEHLLLLTMHHIISDAWSMGILSRELRALYEAFSSGTPSPLPALPIQYADFAVWQRNQLHGAALDAHLAYWRHQLAGAPAVLKLPTDHERPGSWTARGAIQGFAIAQAVLDGLHALSRSEGATLFMTLLAGFKALLYRYTGQATVVVGSPIANRTRPELEGLVGFFVNTLALRTDLGDELTFRELVRRVRETCLGAYAHQDLPFEKLVAELQPHRSLNHNPIFQVAFTLENTPTLDRPSSAPVEGQVKESTAKFDLLLAMAETGEGLGGVWEYSTDLFEHERIRRVTGHLTTLLSAAVTAPDTPIGKLPLMTEPERRRLAVRAPAPVEPGRRTLWQLVEDQIARTPEAAALDFQGATLGYRALGERVTQLARWLRSHGIAAGERVGICMGVSLDLPAAVLAVLAAGAAFVPLEPGFPVARLAAMVRDASISKIITVRSFTAHLADTGAALLVMEPDSASPTEANELLPAPAAPPAPSVGSLAYVLYTSHRSGALKGVAVSHDALCSLVDGRARWFQIGVGDRVLLFASLSSDGALWETLLALSSGATLCLASPENLLPGAALAHHVRAHRITALTLPPAALAQLPPGALTDVRVVIVRSEPDEQPEAARQTGETGETGRSRFARGTGPAEALGWALIATGDESGMQALPGAMLHVLDHRLRHVPEGLTGELYIAGAILAESYLGDPWSTAESFLPDPGDTTGGARMFRTGIRARRRIDGRVDLVGHMHRRIGRLGMSFAAREVERALSNHASIREAHVCTRAADVSSQTLAAFVVFDGPAVDAAELQRHLRTTLPEPMIPGVVVRLDELPRGPDGEILADLLPDSARSLPAPGHVAPRTALEAALAAMWMEILTVPRLGVNDNFFDLGAHSLLVTQLTARIQDLFETDIPLRMIFEAPTVGQLAEAMLAGADPAERSRLEAVAGLLQEVARLDDGEVAAMLRDESGR